MTALAIHLCCFIILVSKCIGQGPQTCCKNPLLPKPTNPNLANKKRPYIIPPCKEPFLYVEAFKKCYFFSNYGSHWTEAKTDCENRRSSLLKLETVTERDWVLRYYNDIYGIWLAATKAQNGTIYWTDGTQFSNFQGCTSVGDNGDYMSFANFGYECGILTANSEYYRVVCEKDLFSY